jgi:hypothetical protein
MENTIETNMRSNNDFLNAFQHYCKHNKIFLYILTPCYASLCYANYVLCLINTINMFKHFDIPLQIVFCKNDSLISRARNNLIAKAMSNPDMTHIIFIDNDITWEPIDILKLIISNKNIVGGVYPLKKYNWNKLLEPNAIEKMIERKDKSKLANVITDESMIQHNLLKYNVNYIDSYLKIEKNLTKVKHIATGFMMIQRETIERMIHVFPETKYTDDVGFLEGDENNFAYALFDCGVEENHYFSEDWLFCHRWTSKLNGDIFLDVSINLKHTGNEDFNGSFISSII